MSTTLMEGLRKMASVSSGDSVTLPAWAVKAAGLVVALLLAFGGGAITTWAQVGQNTKDIANHEERIKALEQTPVRISVIETKMDGLNATVNQINGKLDNMIEQRERGGVIHGR